MTERKLGDEGLKKLYNCLVSNPKLANNFTELELFGNALTDSCADTLGDILEKYPQITSVKLEYNQIGERGAKRIASRILKTSTTLNKLDFYCNPLNGKGITYIAKALRKNRSLTSLGFFKCGMNNESAAALFHFLQQNKSIKSINVENNSDVEDCLIAGIKALVDRNNGKETAIPEEVNKYLKTFKEDEAVETQLEGHEERNVQPPLHTQVQPQMQPTYSQNTVATRGLLETIDANFDASMEQLNIPELSSICEDNVKPYRTAKTSSEQHWLKERKEIIAIMESLLRDKQLLLQYAKELDSQNDELQSRVEGMQEFYDYMHKGLETLAKQVKKK